MTKHGMKSVKFLDMDLDILIKISYVVRYNFYIILIECSI